MNRDELVDSVTRIVMERLNQMTPAPAATAASVVSFGDVPASLLGAGVSVRAGHTPADVEGAAYIVLTQAAFRALHGGVVPVALGGVPSLPTPDAGTCAVCTGGSEVALTGKKVIGEADVRALGLSSGAVVRVDPKALVTALARDHVNGLGGRIVRTGQEWAR